MPGYTTLPPKTAAGHSNFFLQLQTMSLFEELATASKGWGWQDGGTCRHACLRLALRVLDRSRFQPKDKAGLVNFEEEQFLEDTWPHQAWGWRNDFQFIFWPLSLYQYTNTLQFWVVFRLASYISTNHLLDLAPLKHWALRTSSPWFVRQHKAGVSFHSFLALMSGWFSWIFSHSRRPFRDYVFIFYFSLTSQVEWG